MLDAQVVVVDVDEGVLEGSYMSVKNVKMSSMTNLLVGDHQVVVVDVDGGPEGGKSVDFVKKKKKNPPLRQDTIKAPNSDMLPFSLATPHRSLPPPTVYATCGNLCN